MIGLDTNVVIRYLAQDDIKQSEVAARIIEKELDEINQGFISLVTLVEIVWVLQECYEATKNEILQILEHLLRVKEISMHESEIVWEAVRKFANSNTDFADVLICMLNIQNGCTHTLTFDKNASKLDGFVIAK